MISGAKLNGKKFPNYNPMFQKNTFLEKPILYYII